MLKVDVNKVYCRVTTDGIGADDLYIKVDDVKVWPVFHDYEQIDEGETKLLPISHIFEDESTATISLWEYDSASDDDFIGDVHVGEANVGEGEIYRTLYGDGSNYDVYVEVKRYP